MNIDFPPPSNGTYNNAGSSRKLVNYMEHEDLQRMEKGIYTEGFFNLKEDNIFKSKVIKDIDSNIGQLMKTDAKFYTIHVSPSQQELQAMGVTETEQAEAMKGYIREVFIPEYAKNFNKGLTENDIKFYAKIHFERNSTRSKQNDNNNKQEENQDNTKNNMHCHIIVSRKDQANKIKLSPLTNHRNTKRGAIRGGFDRVNLFQSVEEGFDKIFQYYRPLNESFEYYNTMKNESIAKQLKMQEREMASQRKNTMQNDIAPDFERLVANTQEDQSSGITKNNISYQSPEKSVQQSIDLGLSPDLGIFSSKSNSSNEKQQAIQPKKRKRGFRR